VDFIYPGMVPYKKTYMCSVGKAKKAWSKKWTLRFLVNLNAAGIVGADRHWVSVPVERDKRERA